LIGLFFFTLPFFHFAFAMIFSAFAMLMPLCSYFFAAAILRRRRHDVLPL